jgi:dolichol kinase
MGSDWLALAVSYVFVFAAIGIAEGMRKWRGYSTDFTRKFIHITVGTWSVGTVLLFDRWYMAIIPPASFILINYLSYRQETFKAMETGEKGNLGTVYFPFSFVLIVFLFWQQPHLVVASLMPMTWGDAMAAVLGARYGQFRYTLWGSTRSLEGSISMFLFAFTATFLVLWLFPPLGLGISLLYALIVSVITTLVEAVTPWHLDNLTVPLVSAVTLYLLAG